MAAQLLGACGEQDLLDELWMIRQEAGIEPLALGSPDNRVCLNFHDILRGSNICSFVGVFIFSCFDSFVSLGHFYEELFIILLCYSSAF